MKAAAGSIGWEAFEIIAAAGQNYCGRAALKNGRAKL